MKVRVRGIYATALTALADAGFEVVNASPPIRERFDADFDVAQADARIETTDDRQGVELSGADVAPLRAELEALAEDTFAWDDPLARGAVLDGVVERTVGSGAVLETEAGETYLPFSATDERVEAGEERRVQVREPAPPWGSKRAVVGTELRVPGTVATLVRGVGATVAGTPDGAPEGELARLTELLPADVPEGWGVRWEYGADDAGMDALGDALESAAERAAKLDDGLESDSAVAPFETVWLWFGRESRFALDDLRREAAPTMGGHHRTKAAASGASEAVDFAERLGAPESFPREAVLSQFGPARGDTVAIEHGKPDGRLITLGRGEATDADPETGSLTVRREMTPGGSYDALDVPRESGDVAVTKFKEGRPWYPTVYRGDDGGVRGTYVNVCTPVELFPGAARYVDLHVDVIKHADGTVETVDEDELRESVAAGNTPEALAETALDVAERVANGIS
jgi:hypothetical protein